MISPDYFSYRWSLYRPILDRGEQPAACSAIDVKRLPIRGMGREIGDYIPYAVHSAVEKTLAMSLGRLQEYAIRYMVRREKVSAHTLPNMDAGAMELVTHLRRQHPHLPREMLHHWCADPKGGKALIRLCETVWEQGWQQEQTDAAPWSPAVNVLLLKLIRHAASSLPEGEGEVIDQVMLNMVGGLYVWALQAFLKRCLRDEAGDRQDAGCEAMLLPVTPMAFLRYQQDALLLADDSRIIRAYGLESEIVSQLRYLRARGDVKSESGILALLAKEKLGAHLLKRTWARLSLWQLAVEGGHGAWMKWVFGAKQLDRLLVGQGHLDAASVENLRKFAERPVAAWLLAQIDGGAAARRAGEPWLFDEITLMAFRVFDEDVKMEVARRRAEQLWVDRKPEMGGKQGAEGDRTLEKAWQDGELVLIQPDAARALHSGKALLYKLGYLRIDWSGYLASVSVLLEGDREKFLAGDFLPGVLYMIERRDGLLLDECSASGCLIRGSVPELVMVGEAIRKQLHQWYVEIFEKGDGQQQAVRAPAISICMDMADEWTFARQQHKRLGDHKIAFTQALQRINAGAVRDAGMGRLIAARDRGSNLRPIGGVRVAQVAVDAGQSVAVLYNEGFMMTAAAVHELAATLANRADVLRFSLSESRLRGILDGYRPPGDRLELLVIQRHGLEKKMPWLLMQAGRPCLAGTDVEVYELLDADSDPARRIAARGLAQWKSR